MKNVIQGTTLSGTGAVSIAPRTEITIRNPAGQLVPLWADRAGTQPHDNPFLTDDEGNFRVYADSGWVHVRAQKDGSVREWRYVPLGSAAAMDIGEIYEALGSGIYSSVSEGLSNSAEGDFFLVESSGSLDLYRVVNGVAEQRAAGIDDNAILATRAYADGVAAEAESNATNAAVAAASAAYQQATEYSDSRLQAHRESGDHDGRYYTKTEVDHALEDKVDENDPRLSDAREWTAETVSQAEAEAGTSTTRRAWTAQRVRQAIVAGYNALTSAFGRTLANASDATAARDALGLGTAATRDVGTGANNVVVGSDPRLSDAREWTAEVVSQAEAEAGTSSVPRKWTAERVRQAIEALGGGGIDPGDLGTAATRDVTTSPTDTTVGRVLTVGSLGIGNPILLTSSDDLNDIKSPGIYRHRQSDAPANTPIPDAGIVTVFEGADSYVVQVWRRRNPQVRNFQRVFHPSDGWSGWVEFYHTGNVADLISDVNRMVLRGIPFPFPGNTPPPGAIAYNGAELLRADFPELWAWAQQYAVVVPDAQWHANRWGAFSSGNGVTTFRVPDLRGEFIRGWDAGRALGSWQADALQNITGSVGGLVIASRNAFGSASGAFYLPDNTNNGALGSNSGNYGGSQRFQFDASRVVRTANETRPRNIAYLICAFY